MSIEQLIIDCQKNDIKAQEQLYKLYAPKLFTVSLKFSRNYTEAQDNLQEGFILIFKNIHKYSFKGSIEGWLKRVLTNHILQQYRKESFLTIVDENLPEEVEIEIDSDTVSSEFLMKIIQELPSRYRLVFNLYVFEGYSHQEIAEQLNINIGTSKSNLSRAKMILKEKIEVHTGTKKMPQVK